MTDLEDQLTRELAGVADAHPAPSVDLPGVRRVAGRERTRTRALTAIAAAAAVAVVAGLSVVLPGLGDGDRVDPAGTGTSDLGLAWSSGDTVHLPSGRTVRVDDLEQVVSRGGTTLVLSGGSTPRWSRIDESDEEPQVRGFTERTVVGSPALSLDGNHVAWIQAVPRLDRYRVYSMTLDAGPAVVTTMVPPGTGATAVLGVTSADDRGLVLIDRQDGSQLLWLSSALDSAPQRVGADLPEGSGIVLLSAPRVVVYRRDLLAAPRLLELGSATSLVEVAQLQPVEPYAFNDDATAYVTSGERPEVVTIRESGEQLSSGPLQLPAGTWRVAGWEAADTVVLTDQVAGGDPGHLERCTVGSTTCEPVSTDGVGLLASTS